MINRKIIIAIKYHHNHFFWKWTILGIVILYSINKKIVINPIAVKLHANVGHFSELKKPLNNIPHVTKQLTKTITLASKNIYQVGFLSNPYESLLSCITISNKLLFNILL